MDLLTISFLIILLIVVVLYLYRLLSHPYVAREKLLTNSELSFYYVLKKAVGNQANVFCMVRLADVIDVKSSIKGHRTLRVLGRIAQKHLDFV